MRAGLDPRPVRATHRAVPARARGATRGGAERQSGFDALRLLAILGVVAIHVFGRIFADAELRGSRGWWAATVLSVGSAWAVPLFVMISGALVLAPQAHQSGPWAFYRRRVARILPALLFWHLVYLFVVRLWMLDQELTAREVAVLWLDGTVFTALYFLWLILGLYVVAPPLAVFLAAGGPRRATWTAGVVLGWTLVAMALPGLSTMLGSPQAPFHLYAWTMWTPYVGYFLAGWALRNVRPSPAACVALSVTAVICALEPVWQVGARPAYPWLQALALVSRLGVFPATAALCLYVVGLTVLDRWRLSVVARTCLARLSAATFGVFLVHLLVLESLRLLTPALVESLSFKRSALLYVVVLAISFAVALIAARVPYLRRLF